MHFKACLSKKDYLLSSLRLIDKKYLFIFPAVGAFLTILLEIFKVGLPPSSHEPENLILIIIVSFVSVLATFVTYYSLILLMMIVFVIPLIVIRQRLSPIYKKLPATIEYDFNKTIIQSSSIIGKTTINWDSVSKVKMIKHYLVIILISNSKIFVPIKDIEKTKKFYKLVELFKTKGKLE